MNIDKRIDQVNEYGPSRPGNELYFSASKEDTKQLIRDVLEYVKPLPASGMAGGHTKADVQNQIRAEMETKIKEIGL